MLVVDVVVGAVVDVVVVVVGGAVVDVVVVVVEVVDVVVVGPAKATVARPANPAMKAKVKIN